MPIPPSQSRIVLIVVALSTAALGWCAGYFMHGPSAKTSANSLVSAAKAASTSNAAGALREASPTSAAEQAAAGDGVRHASIAGFNAALRLAFALTDDTDRAVRLREIARGLDPADLQKAVEESQKLGWRERYQVMQALAGRWVEIDPQAAAAYSTSARGTRWGWSPFQFAVVQKWAKADSTAALNWLSGLPAIRRLQLTNVLVRSLTEQNPQAALQVLNREPSLKNQYDDVFAKWAESDPAGAAAAAGSLSSGLSRDIALSGVASAWGQQDPTAAIAWAEDRTDASQRDKLLRTIATSWAESDPKAVLAWSRSVTNPTLRQQIFNTALSSLAMSDIAEARAQIQEMPAGQTRDNALTEVIQSVANQDTKTAMDLIQLLPEGRARYTAIRNVASQVARTDAKAAGDIFLSLPASEFGDNTDWLVWQMAANDLEYTRDWVQKLPEAQQKAAVTRISQQWAESDPRAAAEWLGKNYPGSDAGGIAGTWASNSPNDALAWARKLPEGETRSSALAAIVRTLSSNNLTEARDVFSRDLTPEAQAKAAPQLAETWAGRNLGDARSWAESLPQGVARTNALKGLTREWAKQDATAAAQWIEQQPVGETRDTLLRQFAGTVFTQDPESAVTWAATIGDADLRTSQVEQLATRWMRSDANAARQWINSTDTLTPAAKRRILDIR